MITDFRKALSVLVNYDVDFIVVGGVAAALHGSARVTQDLDILYRRQEQNYEKLSAALAGHSPYLRGAPPGLPFVFDALTLRNGLNFTLDTDFGPIDLLGELTGVGGYNHLISHALRVRAFDVEFHVIDLNNLIVAKRAAGRPKDLEALAELQTLIEQKDNP